MGQRLRDAVPVPERGHVRAVWRQVHVYQRLDRHILWAKVFFWSLRTGLRWGVPLQKRWKLPSYFWWMPLRSWIHGTAVSSKFNCKLPRVSSTFIEILVYLWNIYSPVLSHIFWEISFKKITVFWKFLFWKNNSQR